MVSKVAVVTGSNQGIGFGIVKELCRRNVEIVYLTSRDEERGRKAVKSLENSGFYPKFHQLDVTDETSVEVFADFIKEKHGGVDILINNAGFLDPDFYKTTYEDAKKVIDVNFYGIVLMQKYFFPILRDSVEDGTLKEEDFIENSVIAYRVSKVAVSALTRVQQKQVGRGISINHLNPGFVRTNMTRGGGDMTVDEAGLTPAYLALDIDQSVKGKYFWFDKTEVDWADFTLNIVDTFEAFEKALDEVKNN
ncbi:unnamed protein product [Leptosia nina]|uniref:Uncharacterized protein n=1 Tax=Leptosia nina TaxID=320188 RepID=A0AAV1J292_9NEOP